MPDGESQELASDMSGAKALKKGRRKAHTVVHLEHVLDLIMDAINNRDFDLESEVWRLHHNSQVKVTISEPNSTAETEIISLAEHVERTKRRVTSFPGYKSSIKNVVTKVQLKEGKATVSSCWVYSSHMPHMNTAVCIVHFRLIGDELATAVRSVTGVDMLCMDGMG